MTLVERVARHFDALAPAGARCVVAVSGGPDSLALWDLLVLGQHIHGRELVIGHVDHGIDSNSEMVARLVADFSPFGFILRNLNLGPNTSETVARTVRRIALREMASEAGAACVVLGHQADDQAETILLRLLRGSGPAGLAGMSPRRGIWIRPLLSVPRAALAEHLVQRGITPWTDPANADPRHLRSWLRTQILPALNARLPDVHDRLREAGRHASKARRGWDDLPGLLPDLSLQQEKHGISVAALPLKEYSSALRHALLGTLGRRFGVSLGERRLTALDRLIFGSPEGGTVHLAEDFEAELAFGRVFFRRRHPGAGSPVAPIEMANGVEIGGHRFAVGSGVAGDVGRAEWSTWLTPGRYQVRTWHSGDRMRPLGGAGARAVSVLLKEARVPPGRRQEWPVVIDHANATIVWVPGICRSEAMVPQPGAVAVHVECHDG